MRSASDAFARIIAGSHQLATRVDVLFDRVVVAEGLAVVDGSISYDRTAARLASLECTIADPLRIPTAATDQLTPYGYELRVWRGITIPERFGDVLTDENGDPLTDENGSKLTDENGYRAASTELLALGTFPIQRSYVDAVDYVTRVSAVDRSQLVSDARFEDDYQIAAGTNYATAIEDLISDGVSGLTYLFPSVTYTTPVLTFSAQEDRWEAAQRMARSIGHEILFDGLGRCVLRPEPTFDTEPVATIAVGSNMLSAAVSLDREPAYNRVIAFSVNASTGDQYRGVATDDDPQSPTYYSGPFGKKPRFYYSEFLASDAQATSAAEAVLASNLGVAKMIDFSAVPDPRLECSDVVRITCADLSVDDLHIIDRLTIGLGPESEMRGASRAQEGVVTAS